jgi:ABC-type transport system involved in multi-copper enzyme maturation permease subunit
MWLKAWRESRARFLAISVTLSALCAFVVLLEPYIRKQQVLITLRTPEGDYMEYIYNLIYAGTAKGIFALLVIFLGLGGLLRERSHRTAGFTLALPVSRLRVIGTQITVGVFQLAVLSIIPAVLIPGLSALTHKAFPPAFAFHFCVLWFFGGLVVFAASFFLSVVAPGEYTAPVICYIALVVHTIVAGWHPLSRYRLNLLWMMGEFRRMQWNTAHTLLQPPPLELLRMLLLALFASLLLLMAVGVTYKQDF